MAVSLNISTPDAAPTASPYKVSRVSGRDQASVEFTVTGTGPLRAYRLKVGGVNVATGVDLRSAGAICGITRCGAAEPTALALPATISHTIDDSEFASEGSYDLNLYVYNGSVFE